ncbi:hypothetical protein K9M74_00980 [Candidatus Woesearchaeota archaeon]|nr:hypothetical protein [Candidatus Woesearchaeota archaeon]
MGLTNKKEEQLRKMPLIDTKFRKSKDGKYIVHTTTITTIRPTAYFEKITASEGSVDDVEVQNTLADDPMVVEGEDLA